MGLFSILAKLGMDDSDFQAGAKRVETTSAGIGSSIKANLAGAFLSAVAAGRMVADKLEEVQRRVSGLKDASEQFGTNVENVQRLERAALEAGLGLEAGGAAMDKLNRSRAEAVAGNASAVAAFQKLGVSMERVRDPSIETFVLLRDIGRTLNESNPDFETRATLMELMGKSGAKLIPVLKELADAKPMVIITDEEAAKIDKAAKDSEKLKKNTWAGLVKGTMAGLSQGYKQLVLGESWDEALYGHPQGMGNLHNAERTAEQAELDRRKGAQLMQRNAILAAQAKNLATVQDDEFAALPPEEQAARMRAFQARLQSGVRDIALQHGDPALMQRFIAADLSVSRDLGRYNSGGQTGPSGTAGAAGNEEVVAELKRINTRLEKLDQ